MLDISVVGKVSSGKSSFINAFHALMNASGNVWTPIANVSLQRETFQPIKYVFNGKNTTINYKERAELNKKMRSTSPSEFKLEEIYVGKDIGISITDFPGFDDTKDKRDCLDLICKNMGHLTLFVTDASTAMTQTSEVAYFNKIKQRSEELNSKGIYNKLVVVVNKFDFYDDIDLLEIFGNIREEKYRVCPYAVFKNLNFSETKKAQSVTSNFDLDSLIMMIIDMKNHLQQYIKDAKKKYIKWILSYRSIVDAAIIYDWQHNSSMNTDMEIYSELHQEIMDNVIKFRKYKSSLFPEEAFDEKKLMILMEKRDVESDKIVKSLLERFVVDDIKNYVEIYNNYPDTRFANPEIRIADEWKKSKCWEMIESFHVYSGAKNVLGIKPFPADIFDKLNIDIKQFISACYEKPNSPVQIIAFAIKPL